VVVEKIDIYDEQELREQIEQEQNERQQQASLL